jgi:hypothetical protein
MGTGRITFVNIYHIFLFVDVLVLIIGELSSFHSPTTVRRSGVEDIIIVSTFTIGFNVADDLLLCLRTR